MPHQSVFDRLSSTPTQSSLTRDSEERKARSERSAEKSAERIKSPRTSYGSPRLPSPSATSPSKRTPRQVDEFYQRIYKQDTVSSAAHHHEKLPVSPTAAAGGAASPKTPNPASIKLCIKSKSSQKEVDLTTYPSVRKSISNYWQGKLSGKSVALDILEVFWKRDYVDGVGWEVYPGVAEGDDNGVWFGEC